MPPLTDNVRTGAMRIASAPTAFVYTDAGQPSSLASTQSLLPARYHRVPATAHVAREHP